MITSMKRGIYIYMHVQNAPSQLRNILYCKGHTLILITNIKDVEKIKENLLILFCQNLEISSLQLRVPGVTNLNMSSNESSSYFRYNYVH